MMSTALATRRVAPPPAPSILENLEPALSMAADGVTLRQFPPLAEIEQARVELVRAIEARPSAPQVRQVVGKLVLAYPQHLRAESPETYIAAMESEAAGYPLDVLAQACRALLRSSRFVPSVCEMVEACEAVQEKRKRLLRGADRLKREAERHEAERQERERHEAAREAHRKKIEAAMVERWGDAVPAWWSLSRTWKGALECGGGGAGQILAEDRAAAGDGPSWVFCRRAALFAVAIELQHAAVAGYRTLLPRDLLMLVGHLAQDEDAAAAAVILAGNAPLHPEGGEPPSRLVINTLARRALSTGATIRACRAEGLPELPNHDTGSPVAGGREWTP